MKLRTFLGLLVATPVAKLVKLTKPDRCLKVNVDFSDAAIRKHCLRKGIDFDRVLLNAKIRDRASSMMMRNKKMFSC